MVSNEADRVAASGDHLHSHTTEVFLRSLDITRGYNQYALVRICEISSQRSSHKQVPHMLLKVIKRPSHSCVIRIPWLCDMGMRVAELTNDREDPNAIRDHLQWINLGHAFLPMQEVA